jgi:DNA-binding response OmpR family regulator
MGEHASDTIQQNKRRILLVDDDPDTTTFFKLALEDAGFEIDEYIDPVKALLNFKPNYYDLLLIDIRMPKLNGFVLYERLREKDTKVKVCFVTSFEIYYKAMLDEHPSIKKELNCFIKKPITQKDLVSRIESELI